MTREERLRMLWELIVFVTLLVTVIALCSLVIVQPGVPR